TYRPQAAHNGAQRATASIRPEPFHPTSPLRHGSPGWGETPLVMMSGSLELLTQPTARKEYLAATEVWSSDAAYHLTITRRRYADIPAGFRQCLFTGC